MRLGQDLCRWWKTLENGITCQFGQAIPCGENICEFHPFGFIHCNDDLAQKEPITFFCNCKFIERELQHNMIKLHNMIERDKKSCFFFGSIGNQFFNIYLVTGYLDIHQVITCCSFYRLDSVIRKKSNPKWNGFTCKTIKWTRKLH